MIRKAVGAIVYWNDKFLLVGKVKLMDMPNGPVDVPLAWNIPGGGVLDDDESNLSAIKRELREETGSERFEIIRQLDDNLCFVFPSGIQTESGFKRQETVMYLIQYTGDGEDLKPIDEEIERVEFVTKDKLLKRISVEETREYIRMLLEHLSL
jgi:putative (di)nucleoside polyphosphate hydrolase